MTTVRRFGAVSVVVAMAAASALVALGPAQAGNGFLDPMFGANGVATIGTLPHLSWATALARQPDGKIVAVGFQTPLGGGTPMPMVVRLLANGTPDMTFATGGVFTLTGTEEQWPSSVAIQTDGKIVFSVQARAASSLVRVDLVRLTPAGAIDSTFGQSGVAKSAEGLFVNSRLAAVTLQSDGKILVATSTSNTGLPGDNVDMVVRRHNADGSLDTTFGSGGLASADFSGFAGPSDEWGTAIAVAPTGRIVVGGNILLQATGTNFPGFALAAFSPSGALDTTFGTGGLTLTQFPGRQGVLRSLVVSGDGTAYAAGKTLDSSGHASQFVVTRYSAAGALVSGFGNAGVVVVAPSGAGTDEQEGVSVALDPAGGVVAAGFHHRVGRDDLVTVRLQANGAPRLAFGGGVVDVPLPVDGQDPIGVVTDPSGAVFVAAQVASQFSVVKEPGGSAVSSMGWNVVGQLGIGSNADAHAPSAAAVLAGAQSVAAGAYHGLAVKGDGELWGWGWNGVGQLGDGTTTDRWGPVPVSSPGAPWVAVSAGAYHSLGLRSDGTVWAWGWNGVGTIRDGTTTDRHAPVQVFSGAVAISAGTFHSLILDSDGRVWAWGWNGVGQLGDGTTTDRLVPTQIPYLTNIVAIAGGGFHSLAMDSAGHVYAWGWNAVGQLGNGGTNDNAIPQQVSGVYGATAIAAGAHNGFAVLQDGSVKAWGWNASYQLGDGTATNRLWPVTVAGLTDVRSISAGAYHTLATKTDGTVLGWGWNGVGQLGTGGTVDRSTPTVVPGSGSALAISAGLAQSVVVRVSP